MVILTVIYDFDIRCLTRAVVGEWNPALKIVLEEWKEVRAGDDLHRFQLQLATLFEREVGDTKTLLSIDFAHVHCLDRWGLLLDAISRRSMPWVRAFFTAVFSGVQHLATWNWLHSRRDLTYPAAMGFPFLGCGT
jgi:hypothetical protein